MLDARFAQRLGADPLPVSLCAGSLPGAEAAAPTPPGAAADLAGRVAAPRRPTPRLRRDG